MTLLPPLSGQPRAGAWRGARILRPVASCSSSVDMPAPCQDSPPGPCQTTVHLCAQRRGIGAFEFGLCCPVSDRHAWSRWIMQAPTYSRRCVSIPCTVSCTLAAMTRRYVHGILRRFRNGRTTWTTRLGQHWRRSLPRVPYPRCVARYKVNTLVRSCAYLRCRRRRTVQSSRTMCQSQAQSFRRIPWAASCK